MRIHIINPILQQVLSLARAGYQIVPLFEPEFGGCSCGDTTCSRAGKHPRTRNGVKDATNDPDVLKGWWKRWPKANFGLVTGSKSGRFVLDVDGPEGRETLARLSGNRPPAPASAMVRTGRGEHYYFLAAGLRVRNMRIGPGLELRGDDAYAVGPGSRHASGAVYRPASRRKGRLLLIAAPPPDWLRRLIEGESRSALPTISGDERQGNYAEAALSSELERLRHASAGSRNDTLNKCAFRLGQLVGADLLNRGRVESAMASAAREIGLGDKEAQATIRSGLDAGMSQPRIVNLQPSSVQAAVDEQEDSLLRELASLGETDADNARRLARRFSNCLVCTPGNGFLTYDGQRWRRDDTRRSTALAEETARAIALEARYLRDHRDQARRASFANTSLSKGALDRMLDLAKPHLMRADKDFDIEHYKLNVENGTIDLRNGALLKHQSLDMFTKMAAAPYNPAAKCPVFMDFMRKILNDDDDCIRFLQKAVGYTLTGEITEQVLFVLQGPGATGKSTFINLIRDILGDYGLQTPTETLMAKRLEGGIPADLARLDGARMVVAVEANWTQQIDEARVKAMTGGEPIAARHLYGHWFQFQPACKIWLVVNDLPGVRGTAEAFWRRVRLVPFNVVIPEKDRDPNLLKKLKAEAAGILAWAVEGCIAWQREGLIPPDAVKRGVEDWQDKSDHVKRFCTDEIVFEHGNFVTSHDLFQRYQTWCKKNGEKPLDNRKLKGALLGCDLTFKKVNIGSTWRDVKLRLDG